MEPFDILMGVGKQSYKPPPAVEEQQANDSKKILNFQEEHIANGTMNDGFDVTGSNKFVGFNPTYVGPPKFNPSYVGKPSNKEKSFQKNGGGGGFDILGGGSTKENGAPPQQVQFSLTLKVGYETDIG
jgi:hypothetical protein